jgi:hypothetical protein
LAVGVHPVLMVRPAQEAHAVQASAPVVKEL